MNSDNGKNTYDSIEIPENLNELVNQTIASKNKEEIRMKYEENKLEEQKEEKKGTRRPFARGCAAAAAAILVCTTIGLNTSEVFAKEMSEIPVIGSLAKVLTIRSYHGTDGDYNINMDVPKIEADSSLPKEVNDKIQSIVDDYMTSAKKDFVDYKEAFFSTGGTKEEWADRTMDIFIDYDVKYSKDDILSLELITGKGWVSADEEHYYYNLNLKDNSNLTLEGLLGSDYVKLCNDSIRSQIKERMKADENNFYFGFGDDEDDVEGFTTITADTSFYLNKDGNVVITFPKYEIAPGSMGVQEFVIQKSK